MMSQLEKVSILKLIVILSLANVNGSFLGGTISWMIRRDKLLMIYRLSWENSTGPCGPSCSVDDVGKLVNALSFQLAPLRWTFDNGTESAPWGDVSYVLTSFSNSALYGWEQGEGTILKPLPPSPFYVKLNDIPWINPHGTSEPGLMASLVDTRTRNDLNIINQSPYASVPPYVGIAHNCTSVIEIPAEDPDGDRVRCRWAEPSECGGGCTNVPINSVWLDPDTCKININTKGYIEDIYRLAIIAYDYVFYNIKMGDTSIESGQPLSRTPVQLTLRIIQSPCDAMGHLQFVPPTPKHLAVYSYSPDEFNKHVPVVGLFYIRDIFGRKPECMVSGPENITYTYENDDYSRTNVTQFRVKWHVIPTKQQGSRQLCVWGLDIQGLTTPPRCLTKIIFDTNDCANVNCLHNGSCLNVFSSDETCRCTPMFRTSECSKAIVCDDAPCFNHSTCSPTSDGFKCICPEGYTGAHCERQITHCTSSPCNEEATCLDFPNSFQCLCPPGTTDNLCGEMEEPTTSTTTIRTSFHTLDSSATSVEVSSTHLVTSGTVTQSTALTWLSIGPSIVDGQNNMQSDSETSKPLGLELWMLLAIIGGGLLIVIVVIISVISVKRYLNAANAPCQKSA